QDRLLELLQITAGLKPELVNKPAPSFSVRLQRVGLATRRVERAHQQSARPLPQRLARDESLQFGNELVRVPQIKVSLPPPFKVLQWQLVEALRFDMCDLPPRPLSEGRTAPERQRPAEGLCCFDGVVGPEFPPARLKQPLELDGVDVFLVD